MVIFTFLPLYSRLKSPWHLLKRRPSGAQYRSEPCGEEKNLALLRIEPGSVRNDNAITFLLHVS
jgi:hypothetical protein